MPVSKRLRYEVLRRDSHTCRYCGGAAPDVKLTVDHIVPVALGGGDDPTNLVTACRDCNAGKSATAPDSPIVADADARALIWSHAMQAAAWERAAHHQARQETFAAFIKHWDTWGWTDKLGSRHTIQIPGMWQSSVTQFLDAGLTLDDLTELVDVAMGARSNDEWRYFCGCCWRRVRQAQERALAIATEWEEQARGE